MPSLIVINWIVGILGSIGLIGVIALAICAPAAFAVLARIVGDVLRTRLGLAAAVGALCLYGGLVYGDASGRREVRAQWDAAKVQAEAAKEAADADAQRALDAQYQPVIADLQKQSDALQQQVNDYESKMVGMVGAGSCQLGTAPLRLRQRK